MSRYYSFDRIENEFEIYETREEAKASAEKSLQLWRAEAQDDGWPEFMHHMIGYGKLIGVSTQMFEHDKKDYSDEDWEDMGFSLDFDSVADYEIVEEKYDA